MKSLWVWNVQHRYPGRAPEQIKWRVGLELMVDLLLSPLLWGNATSFPLDRN